MILTHLESTTKLLLTVAQQEPQVLVATVPEKNLVYSFMTHGMNMQLIARKDKKFSFTLGAGLHYYMGLSRLTMASTLNFLTIDAPILTGH
jgi:hypothetical protein